MDQKRISWVLLAAGVIAAVAGVFLFFVYGTAVAISCRENFQEVAFLFWPGLIWLWTIGLTYLAAMFYYFRIVLNIGEDRSFTRENATGLAHIAFLMCLAGVLWLLGEILPGLIWGVVLGIGWLALLLAAAASFAMGLLAWALGRLLARAVQLKEENDLTV